MSQEEYANLKATSNCQVLSMLCQNQITHLSHKLLKGSRHVHQPLNLYRRGWVCLGVLPSDSSHWQGPCAIEPFLPKICSPPTEIHFLPSGRILPHFLLHWDLIACMDAMQIFSTSSYFSGFQRSLSFHQ